MQISPDKVQVLDTQQAFDLVLAHLGASATAEQQAIELVQQALTKAGYPKAGHVPVFAKTHIRAKAAGKNQETTVDTASETAKAIFVAATGAALPASAPAAAPAAPAASAPEAAAPVASTTTAPASETAKDSTVTADQTTTVSLTPAEIDKIATANDMVKNAIGLAFANASNRKFQKSDALVKTFAKIEAFVRDANVAVKLATTKLALHQAGSHDEAAAIELPALDSYSSNGLSAITLNTQDTVSVNALLSLVTGNQSFTIEQAITSLKSAEAAAQAAVKSFRDLTSQIRKAAPKTKIAGAQAEDGLPGFDIVMKSAAEIFKDKTFNLPGELLDFEVPTFEWHGDAPADVPEMDPTFRFQGEIVANSLDAISENRIPWLFGESGCGKSEFWQQIAARLKMPFIRVNLDTGVVRSDLIGRTALKPGAQGMPTTEFVEGILVRALKMPCILLLDEFDCGDPEIMPVLQPVLEGRGVRILEDGGRLISPNPWCRIVITANTNGLGSANGAYLNVNEQSAATRNRIASWMEMPYLPESEEVKVVMERLPGADVDFVKKLVQFAAKARDAYRNAESGTIVSTRQVMEAARAYTKFAPLLKDNDNCKDWVLSTKVYKSCDTKSLNVLKALATQIFA